MTDEQLVSQYSEGNNSAFDILLNRYKNKLYSYIYFNVRDNDKADDLFQETFVKAIMTIQQGRYVESGRFGAWLTRIAHNLIIDSFRLDQSDNEISNDSTEYDLFASADVVDDSIETRMLNEQTLKEVKILMNMLPDNQREVVYMRYYQDISFKEIAEMTGVSINTALGRMRYALLNLRRMADERSISLSLL